ncbi:MAG: D-arabinono-1,4-lactone oxidase [Archangium sp.]
MATPQDYANLVAALKQQPNNANFLNELAHIKAEQPELLDTNLNDVARYYRHNTVMAQWPAKFLHPKNEADLLAQLEANKNAFTSFRAMGDAYGFANAAETSGCLVQMRTMNHPLAVEAENFRQDIDLDEDDYFRCEAGMSFGELNTALALTNRTVSQQPGFANLTVGGCANAGGHGSGIGLYGIAGWFEAVEIAYFDAAKNVRLARVERTNGLTDPAKYAATHDAQHELIQNDVLFHSVRCAQGHLGIVTAVTIKVRKSFNLQEDRWQTDWNGAWALLPQMFADPTIHSVHVWINPYATTAGQELNPNVLITRLSFTDSGPQGARGAGILFGGPWVGTEIAGALLGDNPGPGIDLALGACKGMGVVLPSFKALDFGPPNDLAVNASSLGFDAAKGDDVIKALIPKIKAWQADGLMFTSPIGMRWVKASEDFLSPQFGRNTIMLEVPMLKKAWGHDNSKAVDALNRYANFMMNNFTGRPHWGQQNPMSDVQFATNYATGIPSFLTAFKKFNPGGMFDGALTAQLGLRALV